MKRMTWIVAVAVMAAAGCKKADKAAEEKSTAKSVDSEAKTDETKAAAAKPAVVLAAGEALARGENDGASELAWKVDGKEVLLAAIAKDGNVVVRAFTAAGATDVTKPVAAGDLLDSLELAPDGKTVLFKVQSLEGRVPEAGALLGYEYAQIGWDAAAGQPKVLDTWSCVEDEKNGGVCNGPAWTGMEAAPAPAAAAAAATDDIPEAEADPIEKDLDDSWMNDTEGCKPTLDAKDEQFKKDYVAMCVPALARVTACRKDKAFLAAVGDPVTGESAKKLLEEQVGTAAKAAALCDELAQHRFCLYQGATYGNPYGASDVRAMSAVPEGDCAALAKVFPGALYYTGE